jgi:hypothetical protein
MKISRNKSDKIQELTKLISYQVVVCRLVSWFFMDGVDGEQGLNFKLKDFIAARKLNLVKKLNQLGYDAKQLKFDQLVQQNRENDAWASNLLVNMWQNHHACYRLGQRDLIWDILYEVFPQNSSDKSVSFSDEFFTQNTGSILVTAFCTSHYIFGFSILKSLLAGIDASLLFNYKMFKPNLAVQKKAEILFRNSPPQVQRSQNIEKTIDLLIIAALGILFFALGRFLGMDSFESFHIGLSIASLSIPFLLQGFYWTSSNYQLERLPVHIGNQLIAEVKSHWPKVLDEPPVIRPRKFFQKNLQKINYKREDKTTHPTDTTTFYQVLINLSEFKKIPRGRRKQPLTEQKEISLSPGITSSPCMLSITWEFRDIQLTVLGILQKNQEKVSVKFYSHPKISKVWSGYSSYDLACHKHFIYYDEDKLEAEYGKEIVKPFLRVMQVAHIVPPSHHNGLVFIRNDSSNNGFPDATYKAKNGSPIRAGIFSVGKSSAQCEVHESCQVISDKKFKDFELFEVTEFKNTH